MQRITRGFVDGFIYHVINRGNSKQTVFHNDSDYQGCVNCQSPYGLPHWQLDLCKKLRLESTIRPKKKTK
jgi:hypothetical protein